MVNNVVGVATHVIAMAIVISVIFLFLGISVLVLIHVCVVGRTLRSESNVINMVERGSLGSTSMSQDDIEKLPCFNFKAKEKGSSHSPPPDCAVCLENFSGGEKCRLLPSCNHSFHAECVDLWLLRTPICPICRALIMESGSLNGDYSENGIELREGQTTETSPGNEIHIEEIETGNSNGEVGFSQTLEN